MSLLAERFNTKAALPFGRYNIVGGQLTSIVDNQTNYITNGYDVNDIVYSIVQLILNKISIAPWDIYEVTDESSLKRYKALVSRKDMSGEDYRKAKEYQHKALNVVKNKGKWGDLITYPNDYQTWGDFVVYGCGYKMLTGNKYVWADILDGGANKGLPQSLWVMPSDYMQIYVRGGFPAKKLGYKIVTLGDYDYSLDEVMHEFYPNYDFSNNAGQLYGMAPLKSALRLTNRNNSALDASTAKFQNGGLEAIIYVDEDNLPVEQRKMAAGHLQEIKKKLVTEYTGPLNHGKIAGSSYKIGVQQLGLSPVELDIIQAEKWDLRRFCNIFGGVPSQLLNDPENKTYNNQKEGEKALTSRCALSMLTSFRDNLNRQAHTSWGLDKRYIIDFDMTVYSELQEDIADMMKWVEPAAKITGLPPNRLLDLLGIEKIDNPYYDIPRVTTDMGESIEEYNANIVDNILNNDQAGN